MQRRRSDTVSILLGTSAKTALPGRQLFGLTLTLVGLLSWHILPIPHPELAVRAANRAKVAEPTGQTVSRAVANGRVAFVSSEGNASDIYTMNPDGSDRK